MSREQPTVADIFRRGQALRHENSQASYKETKARLLEEYRGAPFPSPDKLAIPEQDARAPEEDWSAGLSLVLRGIQQQDWKEIINGIVLSLEQTENYERTRGGDSKRDLWHDRSVGIKGATEKSLGKWMPADLMALAERKSKE
jgi:hypothetical protein